MICIRISVVILRVLGSEVRDRGARKGYPGEVRRLTYSYHITFNFDQKYMRCGRGIRNNLGCPLGRIKTVTSWLEPRLDFSHIEMEMEPRIWLGKREATESDFQLDPLLAQTVRSCSQPRKGAWVLRRVSSCKQSGNVGQHVCLG